MLTIFVVSDASGDTAERVIRSALVQFEPASVTVVRRGNVRSLEQVQAVIREAAAGDSFIIHTLVSDELRRMMLEEARLCAVDAMDLMGPLLDRLAIHLGVSPQEQPGLFTQSRQIEAVDFAFRHDDGQQIEELNRAEIVLVGVSRTMKTPLSLYLAYRGWFVANVPLVPELPLASPLLRLPAERVCGLLMAPARLAELRRARAERLTLSDTGYASLAQIRDELRYAQTACEEHGWRTIDVTGKPIEELSREVIALVRPERR